eukprot:4308990-Pleurochrysis_carterae.AAC.3
MAVGAATEWRSENSYEVFVLRSPSCSTYWDVTEKYAQLSLHTGQTSYTITAPKAMKNPELCIKSRCTPKTERLYWSNAQADSAAPVIILVLLQQGTGTCVAPTARLVSWSQWVM